MAAGTTVRWAYLMTKKIKKAVIKKSIVVEITFPYKIHLKDNSSIVLSFNFLRIGPKISGVMRSSISHFTRSHALVAISNHTAIPTTLYWDKKEKKSCNMNKN